MAQSGISTTEGFEGHLTLIRRTFVADLAARSDDLAAHMTTAAGPDGAGESLRQAARVAHRLVGVSGTLGFPLLGALARKAEDMLTRTASRPLDAAGRATAARAVDRLRDGMATVSRTGRDCGERDLESAGGAAL